MERPLKGRPAQCELAMEEVRRLASNHGFTVRVAQLPPHLDGFALRDVLHVQRGPAPAVVSTRALFLLARELLVLDGERPTERHVWAYAATLVAPRAPDLARSLCRRLR